MARKLSVLASIILLFTVGTSNVLSFSFDDQVKGVGHTAGKYTPEEVYAFQQQDSPPTVQFSPIDTDTSNFNGEVGSYSENAPVSEPASMLLVGVGLIGLGLFRRKKRKKG